MSGNLWDGKTLSAWIERRFGVCLHNQYFPSLKEVVATVESNFNEWSSAHQILRFLCAIQ